MIRRRGDARLFNEPDVSWLEQRTYETASSFGSILKIGGLYYYSSAAYNLGSVEAFGRDLTRSEPKTKSITLIFVRSCPTVVKAWAAALKKLYVDLRSWNKP